MILSDLFWESETESTLLQRNNGYITKNNAEKIVDHAKCWLDFCREKIDQIGDIPIVDIKNEEKALDNVEMLRIFRLDAGRTFLSPKYRQMHIQALSTLYKIIQDYHQGMGFVVAYFLLFFSVEEVVQLTLVLNSFYVPGYFKTAPVAYVRDAKVFEMLLQKRNPVLQERLSAVVPETYCSKWFVGFNIHVLTFEALTHFFDAFFQDTPCGYFHFKFGLSLVEAVSDKLLKTKNLAKIFMYLRLDLAEFPNTTSDATQPDVSGSFFVNIVEKARDIEILSDDVEKFRKEALRIIEEHTRKMKILEEDYSDINDFSDESDNELELVSAHSQDGRTEEVSGNKETS